MTKIECVIEVPNLVAMRQQVASIVSSTIKSIDSHTRRCGDVYLTSIVDGREVSTVIQFDHDVVDSLVFTIASSNSDFLTEICTVFRSFGYRDIQLTNIS